MFVLVFATYKVLMEVEDDILLIVCSLQGILDQQLKPCLTHSLNIIIIPVFINYIKLIIIILLDN